VKKNGFIGFRKGFIDTNKMAVGICRPRCKLASRETEVTTSKQASVRTTLAALATTSRSSGIVESVVSMHDISGTESRRMSRRHSIARARRTARLTRRVLRELVWNLSITRYGTHTL